MGKISNFVNNGRRKESFTREKNSNFFGVENSALGYNNAQQMVFLKSSVPTYTITAFWESGTYNNFEWKPLFKRTKK